MHGYSRRLLDVQAERLSPLEREIPMRLAIEREPVSLAEFAQGVLPSVGRARVVEAIEMLRRRSLLERAEPTPCGPWSNGSSDKPRGMTFTLQSMVLEYLTDRLAEIVTDEAGRGEPRLLTQVPLTKATRLEQTALPARGALRLTSPQCPA
jgi:hypothetical protein